MRTKGEQLIGAEGLETRVYESHDDPLAIRIEIIDLNECLLVDRFVFIFAVAERPVEGSDPALDL